MAGVLAGGALGVVLSWLLWRVTLQVYRPRFALSPQVCVDLESEDGAPDRPRYRVKILNRSRFTTLQDLAISAQLLVKGLEERHPENLTTIEIPVGSHALFPVLYPANRAWRFKTDEHWRDHAASRVYVLHPEGAVGMGLKRFPPELRGRIDSGEVSLAELLELGDSMLRVVATASHELSGVRRSIVATYRKAELIRGHFPSAFDLKIQPSTPPPTEPGA